MKVSLFLSVTGMSANADHVARQSVLACASVKLAANVVPYYSSLENLDTDQYRIEAGCRIDLHSVSDNRLDDILYLWKRLSDILDTGCLHIEISRESGMVYQGCICKWPHYRASTYLIHSKPVTCANESWHEETVKEYNRARYGKPLS